MFGPALRYTQKKYQQLVRELRRRGLVRALDCEEERVGLFAVWKVKGQSQRLTVDARKANARFSPPPGVDLLSAEALAHIEVDYEQKSGAVKIFVGSAGGCPGNSRRRQCRRRCLACKALSSTGDAWRRARR